MAKANCDDCLTDKHASFWKERSEKPKADSICVDCEQYFCLNCSFKHTDHETFFLEDKTCETKLDKVRAEMIGQLISEGDQRLEKIKQRRIHIVDVVHACDDNNGCELTDVCILRESKQWAIVDLTYKRIQIFNIHNNQMTKLVNLPEEPFGITEIPSKEPSKSLIAVSFPLDRYFDIMNIQAEPAQVISSINGHGRCYDLFYCNNKFITRCENFEKSRHSIHVIAMSGELINVIELNRLPGINGEISRFLCMSVHHESETIYVCHRKYKPFIVNLSLYGEVLHSVIHTYMEMKPQVIWVDKDRNVYVAREDFPLYKLSPDLSQWETIVDEEIIAGKLPKTSYFGAMVCHADTFYIAARNGRVYIIRHE